MPNRDFFVVLGATGNMGGHATRVLIDRGRKVRAITRSPSSDAALSLARLGAEVVKADMNDRESLDRVFEGARGLFSVQNWGEVGPDGEIEQGVRVAEACAAVGVPHVVFGSAGEGKSDSGVAHFDCKLVVEARMRELGLPHTIIRPAPFMELMTAKAFYPAVGVWGGERKVVGLDRPIPWVAAADIGTAIANALDDPDRWIGEDVALFGDIQTLGQARDLHAEAFGRKPRSLPLPLWLISRLAGKELVDMWHWMVEWIDAMGREGLQARHERARALVPSFTDMRSWYRRQAGERVASGVFRDRSRSV